jgi:5,6,7,8-tetrahydromethanopterin hydro-lyase
MEIGEGYVGSGVNAAHVNTVLGARAGPVGTAWASGLAGPSAGHAAFLVVGQPGVMIQPPTLFVNKAVVTETKHAELTWGPAQAGVARGVATALHEGIIQPDDVHELVLIAAVWVDPAADNAELVYVNNASATLDAITNGHRQDPSVNDAIDAGLSPWNAFFKPA